MKSDDSDIQTHYIDALGQRHDSSPAALDAIRAAMQGGQTSPSRFDAVLVVDKGTAETTGPGDLELEDGTTLTVDDRLPADLPEGYHSIRRRDGTTARIIVAPDACYLPESLRIWGWAIQFYAARSRRSWGIGDLADLRRLGTWRRAGGCRDRAHQSARGGFAAPSAAAEPVLSRPAGVFAARSTSGSRRWTGPRRSGICPRLRGAHGR